MVQWSNWVIWNHFLVYPVLLEIFVNTLGLVCKLDPALCQEQLLGNFDVGAHSGGVRHVLGSTVEVAGLKLAASAPL